MGFAYLWLLTHRPPPHIRFVLLGPRVCLHLPSDDISQYRPWCSAGSSGHHGLQRDLHPPSHIPVRFRLPVNSAGYWRCAPCPAHTDKGSPRLPFQFTLPGYLHSAAISIKLSAFRLAPPTRAPLTSLPVITSAALAGFTLPPYMIPISSANSLLTISASQPLIRE